MFEHVGLKNLPVYFDTVRRVLVPGGLFVNHGITHQHSGWSRNLSSEFINRYVFPDAQLDAISNIQRFMEDADFEIADVEGLRPHYALTLRSWVGRLERRHARALEYVSEATYRVWRLYMAASAVEFESGNLGIYRFSPASAVQNPVPHCRSLAAICTWIRPCRRNPLISPVLQPAALQPAGQARERRRAARHDRAGRVLPRRETQFRARSGVGGLGCRRGRRRPRARPPGAALSSGL